MGFFSKIKQNFNHGGVDLSLSAPSSVHTSDSSLPVSVTISGGPEPRTIKRVTAEIIATSRNQSFSTSGASNTVDVKTVARIDNNETFTLAPNETKEVNLALTINGAAEAVKATTGLDPNSTAGKIANKIAGAFVAGDVDAYTYVLQVSADVDGIALDPAKSQPLQILGMGEMGGTFNVKI